MASHDEKSCACSSLVQLRCFDSIWNKLKVVLLKRTTANKTLSGKEEKKHNSPWTSLPDDIMELIMKRLCLKDFLRLREICSQWRATVANAIANKHCHPLPELPVLFLKYKESSTIFSLSTERLLRPKRPLFEKMQTIQGSVEGWMIVNEYVNVGSRSPTIYFVNLVTNARVYVSTLLNFPSNSPLQAKLCMRKMVASSKPDCCDCFLVGLFNDFCHITFCRLSDKSWTTIEADKDAGVTFLDVEIIDKKLYAITSNSILVYDLQDSSDYPPKPQVLAMLPQAAPRVSSIIGNQRYDRGKFYVHLAKDDALGDLFLIYMFCNCVYETQNVGYLNTVNEYVTAPQFTTVEVFKLNTSNETNQWTKVDNLGDRVLFVDGTKCVVISRAELNSTEELITGNSIYFSFHFYCAPNPWEGVQLGMICLNDNSIKYFTLGKSSPRVPFPFWFVPSV